MFKRIFIAFLMAQAIASQSLAAVTYPTPFPVSIGGTGVTAAQGTGTKVQLSTGATTTNDCVKFDASGNTVDAGSACGSGGSVSLTPATPNLVFTPNPITGSGTIGTTDIINAQGTAASYTILSTDMGKTVTHNKATAVAVTLPQAGTTGFTAGVSYCEVNLGAGTVTITTAVGSINGASSLALTQNQSACPISDGTNWIALIGAASASGSGTVTSASVATANGFAGTVANPTTTPAITLSTSVTGIVKGNGTAISAATAGTDYVSPSVATTFTAGQAVTPSTVSISTSTFTPNFALANSFNITLVHASCPCTLANPTNIVAGQSGVIVINQSSTGSDLISTYGGDWKFPGATAPTLSTGASAVDVFSYYAIDSTHIALTPGILNVH